MLVSNFCLIRVFGWQAQVKKKVHRLPVNSHPSWTWQCFTYNLEFRLTFASYPSLIILFSNYSRKFQVNYTGDISSDAVRLILRKVSPRFLKIVSVRSETYGNQRSVQGCDWYGVVVPATDLLSSLGLIISRWPRITQAIFPSSTI